MATITEHHGLPSPIPSVDSPAPSSASTIGGRPGLPTARRTPLKPGSAKEIALINYIDDKVLRITRRYGKKFAQPDSDTDESPGYMSMDQALEDIEPLIDLAWASGTPSVQIPYLLSFAGTVMSYMSAFPFTTNTFRTTRKLDIAFATLLKATSSEAIRGHPVSTTEKVRIRSLAEETKLVAVHSASASGLSTLVESDIESDDDNMDIDDAEEDESTALAISRMYKSTIEILGDVLVQVP